MSADLSILDKSVILRMKFCVFAGYSVLTYANDSLTYCLPDGIKKSIGYGKLFHDWVVQVLMKMHKKYTRFYRFLLITPVSIESSQFRSIWMTFNHLKTNSTKFAQCRLKIRKCIEFFYFQSLMQHSLWYDISILKF